MLPASNDSAAVVALSRQGLGCGVHAVEASVDAVAPSKHRMGSTHAVTDEAEVLLLGTLASKFTACMPLAVDKNAHAVASSRQSMGYCMQATAAVEDSADAVAPSKHRMGSVHAVTAEAEMPLLESLASEATEYMAPAVDHSAHALASSRQSMGRSMQDTAAVEHSADAVAPSKHRVGSVHAVTVEPQVPLWETSASKVTAKKITASNNSTDAVAKIRKNMG